ncbi:hypothetical protein JCM15519_30530 [Fundidesulfovibrio butyratiphilus]
MTPLRFVCLLFVACCLAFSPARGLAQTPVAGSPLAAKPLSLVLDPKHQAVLSAEVSAKVEHIRKHLGEKFEKGDLLVQLDEGIYRPNVQKNQAAATAAAKSLQVTERLFTGKSASALDVENARKDNGIASAGLQQARKELASCRVCAPFPGRVKRVFVHEHEWVDKGRPLIEVVDDRVLQARILLPSTMFGKVRIGQTIEIAVNEVATSVRGVITHVGQVLDPASATFEIHADVDNARDTLRSGMTGTLRRADASGE